MPAQLPEIIVPTNIPAFLGPWGDIILQLAQRVNTLSQPRSDSNFDVSMTPDRWFLALANGAKLGGNTIVQNISGNQITDDVLDIAWKDQVTVTAFDKTFLWQGAGAVTGAGGDVTISGNTVIWWHISFTTDGLSQNGIASVVLESGASLPSDDAGNKYWWIANVNFDGTSIDEMEVAVPRNNISFNYYDDRYTPIYVKMNGAVVP